MTDRVVANFDMTVAVATSPCCRRLEGTAQHHGGRGAERAGWETLLEKDTLDLEVGPEQY